MKQRCKHSGCQNYANSRGWCKPHYDAWFRTGDAGTYRGDRSHLSAWDKIKEIGWTHSSSSGCREWNGFRNELGYGLYRHGNGPLLRVHRVAYENLIGPLGQKEFVLHLCDNPACSNPKHLRKGNQLDNMRDMYSKGRAYKQDWTHCPNGHKYPKDAPPSSTKNRCRECAKERNRRYNLRRKQKAA